jgi:hypothetical protein
MAKPLNWLATAGVKKDATGNPLAGGLVNAYTPGTLVQAAVYADANQSAILSQPITLDAQGRYQTLYTEGVVDLYFYNSDGSFLFSLSRANCEPAVEVEIENDLWTGDDGVPGHRTSLDSALTDLGESTGGVDGKFQHASGGTERALNIVISEFGLSVKSKGALGNDSADDTPAFKTAIAALKTAGGGVLLVPPGTYRINDDLLVDFNGLKVLGFGSDITTISQTSATENGFTVSVATSFALEGLSLAPTGANTGDGVRITDGDDLHIFDCEIGGGWTNGVSVTDLSSNLRFSRCLFAGSAIDLKIAGTSGRAFIDTCSFLGPIGISLQGSGFMYRIYDCQFGGATGLSAPNAGDTIDDIAIEGCDLSGCATAAWNIAVTAALKFHAFANRLGNSPTVEAFSVDLAPAATVTLDSRYFYRVTASATAIDHIRINHLYRWRPVTMSFAGVSTLNHNTGAPPAGFAPILLAGAVPFASTANDTITLVYTGAAYAEIGRAVI